MMEKIQDVFSLSDKEVKAFAYLVEHGERTAGDLAKKTGISRPSLYGFMNKLQQIGLVILSQKDGKKIFVPNAKEKIEIIIDEKMARLEEAKKSVEHIFSVSSKSGTILNPRFQLFEGKEGVKQILRDMFLYKDIETQAYWPIKSMIDLLSADFFKTLNKERIRRRLFTRAIWPELQRVDIKKYPYLGRGEGFFREIRIAPKNISFTMGYWLYGNKAAFISSKKETFGFIIESKELVEMLRSQFEVMWAISSPMNDRSKENAEFLEEIKRAR